MRGWVQVILLLSLVAPRAPLAAEVGGKPEKVDVIVTYAQPAARSRRSGSLMKQVCSIGKYAKIEDARTAVLGVEPGGTAGSDPRAICLLG